MGRYIIRRLLWVVVLLILVSAVTFVIFNLFPSTDPALLRAGRQPTPELIQAIRDNLGLDKPKIVQFWQFEKNVFLHLNFGRSYQNDVEVLPYIRENLPATISLTIGAVVIWLTVGLSVGLISALKRRTLFDRVAMGTTLVFISAPV